MRSSLGRILLSGLLVGSFSLAPMLVPIAAEAGNNTVVKQVVKTVRHAYHSDHIERTTYEELLESLKQARKAPDQSVEYYEAVSNFRILLSSQTGVTIDKQAASQIFLLATEL